MGGFGISIPHSTDTMTITADGFYSNTVAVSADQYQTIILKARFAPLPKPTNQLMSLTRNLSEEMRNRWTVGAETYSSLIENPFIPAEESPETGFAVNINKASYSNIRRFINMENVVKLSRRRSLEDRTSSHFEPVNESALTSSSTCRLLFINPSLWQSCVRISFSFFWLAEEKMHSRG